MQSFSCDNGRERDLSETVDDGDSGAGSRPENVAQ